MRHDSRREEDLPAECAVTNMTTPGTAPQEPAETLPRPASELDDLASYYDTRDTSTEMEHGHWSTPDPCKPHHCDCPLT